MYINVASDHLSAGSRLVSSIRRKAKMLASAGAARTYISDVLTTATAADGQHLIRYCLMCVKKPQSIDDRGV